jgi:hypothetical protein
MEILQLPWSRRYCPANITQLSQSVRVTLHWQFTVNQFVWATSPLRLTTSNFIFQLSSCGYSPSVTSSLTRVWVCRLQLQLVLASAVILKSESRGTRNHILLSQIRDSSPTTRRATVKVFDLASTRNH